MNPKNRNKERYIFTEVKSYEAVIGSVKSKFKRKISKEIIIKYF